MVERLCVGYWKELRRRAQLLPELTCAAKRSSRLGCRVAFNGLQHDAQRTPKLELLAVTCEVVRQQRQLIQPLLELRCRLRHCRTCDGSPSGFAPIENGFFNGPGFGVMAREELRLAVDQFGGMGLEWLGDPSVQLLSGSAQQAVISCVLDKRVLEGDGIRRCAALKYQLGSDEPGERGLQPLIGKPG